MSSNSPETLRVHLEGIHKAMLSLAQHLQVQQDARRVCDHLEWSASHLRAAIRELHGQSRKEAEAVLVLDGEGALERPGPQAGAPGDAQRGSLTEGLRGHTQAITIPEVLGFVSSLRKSGVLRVKTLEEAFLIQLDEGEVVFAKGDNQPAGNGLGEILRAQGVLGAEELQLVLDSAPADDLLLGDALVSQGHITPEALVAALSCQVQMIFHRLFQASDAVFQFDEGAQLRVPEDIRLNVTSLLLESARSSDEDLRLAI